MAADKYTALWLSHSSINDFLACPRSYFLKNVYKDPKTGHKIKLTSPPLALGQAVHEVVESLSVLPVDRRFRESLTEKYEQIWEKVSGEKGGFNDSGTEAKYKQRGREMILRVAQNPGPLLNLAVKIQMDLPYFWLSEEDNIILCGKIDWLEYLPDVNGVHIIDFKTSRNEEGKESLQLPIYRLLVHHCQGRETVKASYWYLSRDDGLAEKELPDLEKSTDKILKIAKQIKLQRQLEKLDCPEKTGCRYCEPYEAILKGMAKYVGTDEIGRDTYWLDHKEKEGREAVLL